jgi:nucleoside-diphosphate-sugar epimerase
VATFFITGVAGFVGSNLAEGLLRRGHAVRGVDNFLTGRRENLDELDGLDFREADILDTDALVEHLRGVDYVLHQAAVPSVPRSLETPLMSHANNATGTLSVLEAARRAGGIRRLVYAGSSSVYGQAKARFKSEDLPPSPLSPYAVSKLTGEHYARVYSDRFGLETVTLRYFNVFGPRQDPNGAYAGVIPKFIARALSGSPIPVHGDGTQTRDFTYVENVVDANERAATAAGATGRVINVACGSSVSLLDLIDALRGLLPDENLRVEHEPSRSADIKDSLADISLARQLFGYEAQVDFRTGLERTLAWYRGRGTRTPSARSRQSQTSEPDS